MFNESGGSLDATFVDGIQIVANGRISTLDEEAILAEIAQEHAALLPLIAASENDVSRLAPSYRRI